MTEDKPNTPEPDDSGEIADALAEVSDVSTTADDETPTLGDEESGDKSLFDRLMNSEPNPSLESVESPWNPDEGGLSRVYRGLQKAGDITGLPAIADIVIGAVEEMQSQDMLEDGDGENGEEYGHPNESETESANSPAPAPREQVR